MSERGLLGITALIWITFGLVTMVLFIAASDSPTLVQDDGTTVVIMFSLAAAATLSTAVIWLGASRAVMQHGPHKVKRNESTRMERLMQLMEEDDIVELESMLTAREYDSLRRNQDQ